MKENSFISSLTPTQKLWLSLGSLVVLSGGGYLTYRTIKKRKSDREENFSLDTTKPSTYAKQIKMAFENDGWFGTNVPLLRKTFIEIPSAKFLEEVATSYKKLYDRNLYKDLASELQSTEYDEILYIISQKRLSSTSITKEHHILWAKRLKSAFDKSYGVFPGTDERAIRAVFLEIPTQYHFVRVAVEYQVLYGSKLMDDIKSELEFWELDEMMLIILKKPKK